MQIFVKFWIDVCLICLALRPFLFQSISLGQGLETFVACRSLILSKYAPSYLERINTSQTCMRQVTCPVFLLPTDVSNTIKLPSQKSKVHWRRHQPLQELCCSRPAMYLQCHPAKERPQGQPSKGALRVARDPTPDALPYKLAE